MEFPMEFPMPPRGPWGPGPMGPWGPGPMGPVGPSARGAPMGPHGAPMGAHGAPWRPMGPHGRPWAPMGGPWAPHGAPWVPLGAHGAPMGAPCVVFGGKTTKNIKNGLNGVEVAPFGLSLGRNGATGGAEPLGLLPRPILGLNFFFRGFRASGPWGPWDCPMSPLKGQ